MLWLSLAVAVTLTWERPAAQAFSIASVSLSTAARLKNQFMNSECDDNNVPPCLSILTRSIRQLESGSDVRGQFVDHPRIGSIVNVAYAIASRSAAQKLAPLTPFAAHCLGYAFATFILQNEQERQKQKERLGEGITIAIGRDPREHGPRLADAFARGALSVEGVRVVYTGIATTPAMFEFCR
jgi:hypothetical protein